MKKNHFIFPMESMREKVRNKVDFEHIGKL